MKDKDKSNNNITDLEKMTLKDLFLDITYRLNHIEDITADDRALLVKLVKQNNTIVKFLSDLEISEEVRYDIDTSPINDERSNKIKDIKSLIDEYMDRREEFQELEKELQKNKDNITPGIVGEA
tara:strand:+ start:204 stop:575 length:372 start_codon:yes stop_codon:yes gene_type:complete